MQKFHLFSGGFEIEDESTVTEVPNSYQQGHSVSYVQQKFDFLESNLDTSVAELKEERNPDEIRKETNGQFFEAETPEKSKKNKKRFVETTKNMSATVNSDVLPRFVQGAHQMIWSSLPENRYKVSDELKDSKGNTSTCCFCPASIKVRSESNGVFCVFKCRQ